jgi:hypothetical protein
MRFESVILSLIHLFSLIFFMGLGCIALSAAVNVPLRGQMELMMRQAQNLLEPKTLAFVGLLFLLYGLTLLVLLLLGYRKSFLRVSLRSSKVLIDRSIIHEYVESYFKTLMPNQNNQLEIIFHPQQKLEILTKLPETQDREILLKRIENELGVLLARKLGYKEEFILTLHEA